MMERLRESRGHRLVLSPSYVSTVFDASVMSPTDGMTRSQQFHDIAPRPMTASILPWQIITRPLEDEVCLRVMKDLEAQLGHPPVPDLARRLVGSAGSGGKK
jgi:hypothetical protein